VSSLILSYTDDEDPPLVVYSNPPRPDGNGRVHPAQITVQPWSPEIPTADEFDPDTPVPVSVEKTHITMYFSIDEAAELARKLIEVVLAAKDGVYSELGIELAQYSREKDLNDAWKALGLSDDTDT
jgi:hypothetical protein